MPKRRRSSVIPDSDSFSESLSEQDSDPSVSDGVSTRRKVSKSANKTRKTRTFPLPKAVASATPSTAPTHSISTHVVANSEIDQVRKSLLAWYDKVHDIRGMPWRKRYDPSLGREARAQRAYEVWISEIMLQQTQVATVIPYYNKWMTKFPSIADLAASDIETVNGLWKGLGYYSRAARLLKAAQKVVEELGGRLPDNAKDMQAKIPGVGRYSAGAVCSIAYNECVPVLDGNVHRLLSRFLALHAPPKGKQTLDILWAGATAFVQNSSRPGDINQALIELGSTVCKVREPACSGCAISSWCQAYKRTQGASSQEGTGHDADIEELCTLCEPLPADEREIGLVTIYPMKVERKKAREELDIVNVVEWRREDNAQRWFILVRRPEGGLLAGLHEFPTVAAVSDSLAASKDDPEILDKWLSNLFIDPPSLCFKDSNSQKVGCETTGTLRVAMIKPVGDVVHVFSHIKKTYRVQWVILEGGGDKPPGLQDESRLPTVPTREMIKGNGKDKRQKVSRTSRGGNAITSAAQWVPLDEVESINIGTGVMKVWKLTKTLWE
ncbi:DNA glycosylase [Pisolithus croceorrhizus]|nr:DNA glycosylase [Pisolithus croceorrhizus]